MRPELKGSFGYDHGWSEIHAQEDPCKILFRIYPKGLVYSLLPLSGDGSIDRRHFSQSCVFCLLISTKKKFVIDNFMFSPHHQYLQDAFE
jgi:hypothetical protein